MRNLTPKETWSLIQQQPDALFVDVRMEIESMYVGRPPGVPPTCPSLCAWSSAKPAPKPAP
jgi:hypothetical protein